MLKLIFQFLISFWIAFPLSYQIRDRVRGNIVLRVIRIVSINIPYLIVFFVVPIPYFNFKFDWLYIVIVVLAAIGYTIGDFNNLKKTSNLALFPYLDRVKGKHLLSRGSEVLITPVIEEMFYRGVIPIKDGFTNIILIFLLSTSMFGFAHYMGEAKELDYQIKLFIISIVTFTLYYWSQNIVYSILFHMLCNLPWFFVNVKMYFWGKKFKN